MDIITGLAGLIAGLIISRFVPSYFGAKGKNLATKEDIEGITRQIESVKHSYATQLEITRAQLTGQLATHGHRYQREFTILESLTRKLVDVRDHAAVLRPVLDQIPADKTPEQVRWERINALWQAQRRLNRLSERARPFYPGEIYDSIQALEGVARTERIKFTYHSPENHPEGFSGYWSDAEKTQEKLKEATDVAINKIRDRVARWDAVSTL